MGVEVAFIGEENFYLGCELLTFSKDSLKEQDKIGLENKSDFDILMSVVEQNQISKTCLLSILTLIFPTYKIDMGGGVIVLMDENGVQYIRAEHFDALKQIITEMFCLNRKNADGDDYNPGNEAARKMAERFRKARQKKAEMRGEDTSKINILSREHLSFTVVQAILEKTKDNVDIELLKRLQSAIQLFMISLII